MNIQWVSVYAIFKVEMRRMFRTSVQSLISPVLSTVLYFIVFGAAIGSRIQTVEGLHYGAFIVPGLMMMTILTQSLSNGSFGIYLPRFTGAIYEVLSSPLSPLEVILGYVGAATLKSIVVGLLILGTSEFFVSLNIEHPFLMIFLLFLTSLTFSLYGFLIGLWADGFEKLQLFPSLVAAPLSFLGGAFYSLSMLPEFWQKISLLNPFVYLISAFRWSFYEKADVNLTLSFTGIGFFLSLGFCIAYWILKTGHRLKS